MGKQLSPQIYDLAADVNKYIFMLSQMALNESWQNGLDPAAWSWVNPATGAAWAVANLYAATTPVAAENARLRTNVMWDIRPVNGMTDAHVILKQHMKFESFVSASANLDLTNCFMGFSNGAADTGATNGIIGFRYVNPGAGVTIQAVCDNGGVETTVNIAGITVTDVHKFEIIVAEDEVEFWIDDIHRTTITTNLSDAARYANLYWAFGGGGGATVSVGYVQIYPEVD